MRVLLTRSDPAKSTRCNLERLMTSCPTYPYAPPFRMCAWMTRIHFLNQALAMGVRVFVK